MWQLATDLPVLGYALEQADLRWKEEFFNLSSSLDYSWLILHDGQLNNEIKVQEQKDIDETIDKLIKIVIEQIIEEFD